MMFLARASRRRPLAVLFAVALAVGVLLMSSGA